MRVAGVMVVVVGLAACNGGGGDDDEDAPAAGPLLVWDSAPYDVGLVEVGTAATRTVTLRNTGGASTGVVLSTDGAELTILQDDCVTLAPGATCDAMVQLAVSAG